MIWRVTWRVGDRVHVEEFVYRYNAREWVHVVRRAWGVEATVTQSWLDELGRLQLRGRDAWQE